MSQQALAQLLGIAGGAQVITVLVGGLLSQMTVADEQTRLKAIELGIRLGPSGVACLAVAWAIYQNAPK